MSDTTDTQRALGDGGSATRVLAGDCTVIYDSPDRRREHRGLVTVLVKPDNTVLVHDADGYQPVAWLTRASSVSCRRDGEFTIDARDGDARLRVAAHVEDGYAAYPVTPAGIPVGSCPDCGGAFVRANGAVTCLECAARYGLPAGASIHEELCECGLPRMRVERGEPLDVCIDRDCDPLEHVVAERFDRAWECPECSSDLRILQRGGLLAGCDTYPECEPAFSIPAGTIVDECACGLPVFDVGSGRRCLDARCDHSD